MSSHPYRQKMNTSSAPSAPYPVDNFEDAPNSIPTSVEGDINSPYSYHSPLDQLNQLNPQATNESFSSANQYIPPSSASSSIPLPQSTSHHQPQPQSLHQNVLINGMHKSNNELNSIPYPVYDSQTPPPVFAGSKITSPPSNSFSSSSSVTNLNLNQSSHLNNNANTISAITSNPTVLNNTANGISVQDFSKSETNLLASAGPPPSMGRFTHSRSASSTSSFFHDKSDNASMVDFSQNLIQQYLGDNSSHLLPRIKTIDMYRKNAKKSSDPTVLFQYAQYMLQTALLLDGVKEGSENGSTPSPINGNSPNNSPKRSPLDPNFPKASSSLAVNTIKKSSHTKSKSNSSFEFENATEDDINDVKLKRALLKEAVHYLRKLADKGYTEAQYLLGDAYSSGALGKIDNKEAFSLFQAAAKHGHIECAYRTSYCYEEGLGTGRDARKAIEYLKMAASRNHASSMYKLGIYSFYGRMGIPNDMNNKKMGIKWLSRASNIANELVASAPYELGKIYFNGFEDIIISDKKYALELYSQAAALGHVEAASILGKCYEVGEVLPQDSNLSIHYYTQAALGGDPTSMLAMCAWYLVGSDPYLPKDESEAFEWAKRAAVCSLPKAQFALANFYEKGIGCIKDVNEAQVWYKRGAENGDEKCLSRLNDKEVVAKLQKKIKKQKSSNKLGNNDNGKNAPQDKDCIIM